MIRAQDSSTLPLDLDTTTPTRDSPQRVTDRLRAHHSLVQERAKNMLGYPESGHFDYEPVREFMNYNVDNLGDPFSDGLYGINSVTFEREVIEYFAELYDMPAEQSWGYVTGSGSEGNMYGLYLGRELHPEGVLYYSSHTHYSVAKAGRMLRMAEVVVPAQHSGQMDYEAFEVLVKENADKPVIVNANIGTTMTGAIDDVELILDILNRNAIKDFYIHCDAALSGMMLPFMENAPKITFSRKIGSVSVSGHKFMGAPYPCGIVIARKHHVERIQQRIEYIGALDATIGGSRNGQAPLYLWHAINTRGEDDGFVREVRECMDLATYLYDGLQQISYPCRRNEHSNTVVFAEPGDSVVRKWQLARQGGEAHVITVPHASRERIEAFLADLQLDRLARNGSDSTEVQLDLG